MSGRNIGIVFRKELMDTLRDRKTLVAAILVPILSFPVLILGFAGVSFLVAGKAVQENPSLMILGRENAPELVKRMQKAEIPALNVFSPATKLAIVPEKADYVSQINDKRLRSALEIPAGFEDSLNNHPDQTQQLKIFYFEGEFRSIAVMRAVAGAVRKYSNELAEGRLTSRSLPATMKTPFELKQENVASLERVTGNILGMLLPYMVIILCLTGAMYPAMDLTAGEKERGTMETILVSPAARSDIVLGKFLLILTFSLVTTALSIFSFAVSVIGGAELFQRLTPGFAVAVSTKAAVAVLFLILPLAILFSAALMAVSIYARSYREAQTLIGPSIFIVIFPAMASMAPGVELNHRLALVPILNVSLVSKEIFAGNYPWAFIASIFLSTTVYALVALYFASRQFQKEEVLFRV